MRPSSQPRGRSLFPALEADEAARFVSGVASGRAHEVDVVTVPAVPAVPGRAVAGGASAAVAFTPYDGAAAVVVLSIKQVFADALLAGTKRVELRRRFRRLPRGAIVALYVSAPVQAIVGAVAVRATRIASPSELWAAHAAEVGVDRHVFETYFRGVDRAVAIQVEQARRWPTPLGLPALRALGFTTHPNYTIHRPNTPLAQAIATAEQTAATAKQTAATANQPNASAGHPNAPRSTHRTPPTNQHTPP